MVLEIVIVAIVYRCGHVGGRGGPLGLCCGEIGSECCWGEGLTEMIFVQANKIGKECGGEVLPQGHKGIGIENTARFTPCLGCIAKVNGW